MKTTLKRHLIPGYWSVKKKENVFVVRPMPGPHKKDSCIPLQVILRDILGVAQDAREAKKILKSEKVLVDKKARKEPKYPAGLMDIIEMPESKKFYVVDVNKKGLCLEPIKESNADRKLCKIVGKTTLKGDLTQLNLHDGRNIILKKDAYSTGDSLLLHMPEQKIIKHFKFQKGEKAKIISGKNMGVRGNIHDIKKRKTMLEKSTVTIKSGDREIETLLGYVMVGET